MPSLRRRVTAAFMFLLLAPGAYAAEPVKKVNVFVQPFYQAARAPGETPQVAVGTKYNKLLESDRREDILAARDLIVAEPKLVTPMTLMVLAIRLYDVGLRDDAVFWFYAAKDRYITLTEVAEANTPLLARSGEAMRNFNTLAGPVINGYAFCDLARQKAQRAQALAWVESNPYDVVFMEKLPARTSDRKQGLAQAIRNAKANAEKERVYFDDPKNIEAFNASRRTNEMDAKFCWK